MPVRIGPYTISREIGRGGMGVVYLARDTKLDRDVAIKALPPELAEDADRLARFEREAKTLAQLNHPNVAGIHGVEEQDGQKYLILEFVEGETLADRLDRGALPVDEALEVGIQIAAGIEAAHEAGVIHRDLKPDNIKITPDGNAKVLDFGIARTEDTTGTGSSISDAPTLTTPRSPTEPGQILGTAPYMSPEQARGRRLDKRSDIWSFGVLLYECLTGMSPFVGETVSDSIGAILHKDVELDRLPPGSSPLLRHVISRCLQRDRNKRLRDIGDARLELMAIAAGERDDVAEAATVTSSQRAVTVGLAAVVLVSALTGLGVWIYREPEPPQVMHFSIPQARDQVWYVETTTTFAIARDGRSVVYRALSLLDGQFTFLLILRHRDQIEPIALADLGIGVNEPFFSPDGQWIGYTTVDEIRAVSVNGGAPRRICSRVGLPGQPVGLVWRSDGRIVFGTDTGGLYAVPVDGGTPTALTTVAEGEQGHLNPDTVPGTDLVLFTIQRADTTNLAWYSLDTNKQGVLLEDAYFPRFLEPGYLIYAREGQLRGDTFDPDGPELGGHPVLLEERPYTWRWLSHAGYTVSQDGTLVYRPYQPAAHGRTLIWIDREGHDTSTSFGPGPYGHVAISPSGSKVALEQYDGDEFSLWMGDIQSESKSRFSSESGFNPVWSPDGTQLIWASNEADSLNRRAVEGSGPIEKFAVRGLLRAAAPDGEQFVVSRIGEDTNWDLWLASIGGEAEPFIVEPGFQYDCAFSNDGKWVVYRSILSGGSELFVCPYPDVTAEKVRVPGVGNKTRPIWSRNGSELFFIRDDDKLMVAPVTTSPTLSIGEPKMLYADLDVDLNAGSCYAPMPDGQRFLVIKEEPTRINKRPEIHVVVNWIEELKAKLNP